MPEYRRWLINFHAAVNDELSNPTGRSSETRFPSLLLLLIDELFKSF